MKRTLLNLLTALSALLAAALCVQWYRGYRVQDSFSVGRVVGTAETPVEQRLNVVSCTGALWFSVDSSSDYGTYAPTVLYEWRRRVGSGWGPRWSVYGNPFYPQFPTGVVNRFGFHLSTATRRGSWAGHAVVPTWFALACAAALPAGRLLARWRRAARRPKPGCCPACGYDLTANVSGVCPECGEGATPG